MPVVNTNFPSGPIVRLTKSANDDAVGWSHSRVSRGEWVWVMVIAAIVLLLASLPVLAGWMMSSQEREFGGFVLHLADGFSYLAKMRLGADGEWLYSDRYAVELHEPIPLFIPYLLLGKLSGPSPTAILFTFHMARVVFGAALLLITYRFLSLLLTVVWQRRLAWLLVIVGGGLGWLMIALTQEPLPLGSLPIDFNLGEAFSSVALMSYPHTALARSALLVGVMWYAQRLTHRDPLRQVVGSAAAWLIATVSVPFNIVVAGGAVAGLLIARWLTTRRIPVREAGLGALAGLPAALYAIVLLVSTGNSEVYGQWTAQNLLSRPHPAHFISAFGIPLILAIFGTRRAWTERRPYADLFIGWTLVSPLLTLIPINVQLRLIEAFAVPLFTLAVLALDGLRERPVARGLVSVALLVALLPSTLLLSLGGAAEVLSGSERVFLTDDEVAAYAWLDAHAPAESVLLSSGRVGLIAPSRSPVRAVLGHGFETPYFERKRDEVAGFYSRGMYAAERQSLLERYDVQYVWWGPDERMLGDFAPDELPGLLPVFTHGQVTLYAVQP
ncbi:MAG TPA: hypothetical protein VJ793_20450 [Anaerolineae bacterium]|nr:hypothetical protein [Anaerolineae bacterium]